MAICLYDRWTLKFQSMKRRFIILLSIQTLLIIVLLAFSIVQKAEADQQRERAIQQKALAEEYRAHAEMAAYEAERIKAELQSRLDSLRNR